MCLTKLAQECEPDLDVLKKSPTFAMSRGAKELFHTNFLSFVLDTDASNLPNEAKEVVEGTQKGILRLLFGDNPPSQVLTWREKNRLDLIVLAAPLTSDERAPPRFVGTDAPLARGRNRRSTQVRNANVGRAAVVVEAKLKALPDQEQLKRYNEKLTKGLQLQFDEPLQVTIANGAHESDAFFWGRTDILLTNATNGSGVFWAYDVPSFDGSAEDDDPKADMDSKQGSRKFAGATGHIGRVLLAPKCTGNALENTGWTMLDWKELLAKFPDSPRNGDPLLPQLLYDYRRSTEALLSILERLRKKVQDWLDRSQENIGVLRGAVSDDRFKSLRIHDLVGKYAYSILEHNLRDASANELRVPDEFELNSYTFMSNSTPGLAIELRKKSVNGRSERTVSIGVQIQGTEYRHFVSASHPNSRPGGQLGKFAQSLADNGKPHETGWWKIDDRSPQVIPNSDRNDFGKFNQNAFLYTSGNAADLNFGALKTALIASMKRAVKQLEKCDFCQHTNAIIGS